MDLGFLAELDEKGIAYALDENVASRSTFKIGGVAAVALYPDTVDKLCEALSVLRGAGVKYEVIGNASNTLFAFDRYNGAGGSTAHVTVEVSKEGAKVLGIAPGNRVVRYSGGPLAYPTDPAKCEGKGISLGAYKSSVSRSTKHLDKFIGSSGWIYGTFGKGKIIATSFHPEYWDSTHDMMLGCFYAVTGVKMTPVFPKKNRRPLRVGIYSVGINGHDVIKTMLDLERHPDIDLHYVMTAEVNQGLLRHLDYFVMPNGVGNFIKKYANRPFTKKVLKDFVDRGGIILAGGNAAKALPDHKNIKKLPAKVDFKKYILK